MQLSVVQRPNNFSIKIGWQDDPMSALPNRDITICSSQRRGVASRASASGASKIAAKKADVGKYNWLERNMRGFTGDFIFSSSVS
jgi:hypothetical protein